MEAGQESSRSALMRVGAALAALVAIVILAALFDLGPFADDGDELSRTEFLTRGDEICGRAHGEFKQLQADQPQTASEAAELTARLIDISERELDDINDLDGPDELDRPLDAYLSSREEGIEQLRKGFEAAEDKDAFAYATAQAKVAGGQLGRLEAARAVGFKECSRPLVSAAELKNQSEPPG